MSMEQLDEKLEHLSSKLAELENQRRKIKNKRPLNKKQLKDKEEEIRIHKTHHQYVYNVRDSKTPFYLKIPKDSQFCKHLLKTMYI
jgi:hypothetical protein